MAMDVSTLSVRVESKGIDTTTKSLEGLEKRAGTTEAAVMSLMDKLGKSSASVLSVVQSMNQLRAAMQGALPNNAISTSLSDFKKMSDEIKSIQSTMGKGVGGNISVTIKEMGNGSKEAVKGVESLNQSLASGQNIMQAFGKELYHIRNLLGGTMLAGALLGAAKSAVEMADSWTLMSAKLKIFVGSSELASLAQEKLFKASVDLKVPLEGVTTLFTRLVPAMTEYGYSTESALTVTKTMAAALKISGATGAEVSSVMLQFSQSMAAGRLNGAEFNAVAEGAPIVLRLLSKELGVTRGQLKAMAADGLLSTTLLTETLKKYSTELQNTAKEMPLTVGAAFDILTASVTKYIGELNKGTGATGVLASGIKLLADNLDRILAILKYAIVAWGTYTAGLFLYNSLIASSTALTASLVVELGLVGVSATAGAGGVGLLSGALTLLSRSPILVILSLIVAAGYAIYDSFYSASDGMAALQQQFKQNDMAGNTAAALTSIKDIAKASFTEYGAAVAKLDEMKFHYNNLTEAQKQFANSFGGFGTSTKAISDQEAEVKRLSKAWKESEEAVRKYIASSEAEKINQDTSAIQQQIDLIKESTKRKAKLTDSEEKLWKAEKSRQEILSKNNSLSEVQKKAMDGNIDKLKELVAVEKENKNVLDATKKSKKEGESFEKKYNRELESIKAFINTQNEELGLTRKLTEADKESLKVSEFITNNRAKLSSAQLAELNVKRDAIVVNGLEIQYQKDLLKVQTEAQDKYYKERSANLAAAEATRVASESLQRKIDLQKLANADITETALGEQLYTVAVNASTLASINRAIAVEQEAKALEQKKLAMAGSEGDQELARKAIKDLDARVESLNRQKSAIEEILPLQQKLTEELSIAAKKSMLDVGRSPGQILAEGFGEAGAAIAKMSDAYKTFGDDMAKVDKYVADQKKMLLDQGPQRKEDLAKVDKEVAAKRIQISAGMYASMAGAAKGFFTENSRGYQAMAKAEKAFRVMELTMAMANAATKIGLTVSEVTAFLAGEAAKQGAEETTTALSIAQSIARATAKAVEAVASAFAAPFPINFAAGAAMIAIMAGLGLAVGGGGGSTPNFSAERQASAGTGSIFGDKGAKSESASKSLEIVAKNSEIANQYNEGMLNALKNIESGLTGLTKSTIRSGVQTSARDISGMGTTHASTAHKILAIGGVNSGLSIASLGVAPVLNAIGNALFSVKKSVVDSGIVQQAQSLSDIALGGTNLQGYATVETKRKKFGRTKTSTEDQMSAVSDELQQQFTSVILGMSTAITESAKVLNLDTVDFTNTLNSFVVDIGHISLHDMSAKQIEEQFAAIFSKMGDDMAQSALPMLEQFQNVGEGYLETLLRVSSAVATVDGIFKTVGTTFGQVGINGVEAKMHLIDLAGGLEKLSGLVSDFFGNFYTEAEQKATLAANVSQKLISLGITGLDVTAKDGRIAFRKIVEQYKDTNSDVFIELLKLQGSVNKLAPAFEDANKAVEDTKIAVDNLEKIAQQKLNLDIEMFNLQGNSLEAIRLKRESEIKTIDTSLVALQQLIWKIGDLKAGAHTAMTSLEKSVTAEKTALKKSLDIKVKAVEDLKVVENSRYEAERKAIQDNVDAQNATIESRNAEIELANKAKEITNDSLRAQIDSIKETRNNLKGLFDSIGESIRSIIGSTDTLQSISYETAKKQLDVALATRSVYDTEQFKTTLSALSGASGAGFGSSFEFNKEKLVTAGKLFDLQSIVGSQIAAQDATVVAIEASIKANVDAIEANKVSEKISADEALKAAEGQHILNISKLDDQIKVLNLQYNSDIEYLDNILVEARKQLDMADGIYMETKGVKDAVNTFATALTGYITAKDAQTVAWVNQISAMAFSTIPTLTAIAERTSTENQQLKDEVVGLREDAAAQSKAIAISSAKTAKVLTQWDGDGQPETRVV